MLVVSRKKQEAIVVGGTAGLERLLKVTVLEIGRGRVKLGFEVDTGVPINRWEVWQRIRAPDVRTLDAGDAQRSRQAQIADRAGVDQ